MTPEERRKRVEYVVKMAELGILAEPAYDREEWRAQKEASEIPTLKVSKPRRPGPSPRKAATRRTA